MSAVILLHSIVRYFVLIFGIWAVVRAFSGVSGNKAFTPTDKRANTFFMISCDIQLLLGLILFFINGWSKRFSEGMSTLMKDPFARFFTVEHTLGMLIAIILVHIGVSSIKKTASDNSKHKKVLIFSGIALLLIIISIPWPFREVGRPWFQ